MDWWSRRRARSRLAPRRHAAEQAEHRARGDRHLRVGVVGAGRGSRRAAARAAGCSARPLELLEAGAELEDLGEQLVLPGDDQPSALLAGQQLLLVR